ncbi:hypothetical protein ACIRYZ_07310 [Kitasatospora sp. NPDC101155]|uniref:hypothetical protein n=1 Tax=Kitasatospora sp. NPDC101155 TaxID=3364097 RepID=UPI00382172D6
MTTRSDGTTTPGAELVVAGGALATGGATPYPFPVVVEVRGITEPARFSRLTDALTALLDALRALPLSSEQREFFEELFGPSAVQTIGHRLAMYGEVRSLAFLDLTPHVVRVYPADFGAPQ